MRKKTTTASESNVQARVRLAAQDRGWWLFRNNSGAFKDENGRVVRYGLGNDSAQYNAEVKSSDLIGWRPVTITQDMVGKTIAQFVSIECKKEGWRYAGDARERAQKRWLDLVLADGGEARFVSDPNDF